MKLTIQTRWLPLCAALFLASAAHAQRAAKDVVLDQVAAPIVMSGATTVRNDAMVVSVLVESPDGTLRPRSTETLFRTGERFRIKVLASREGRPPPRPSSSSLSTSKARATTRRSRSPTGPGRP